MKAAPGLEPSVSASTATYYLIASEGFSCRVSRIPRIPIYETSLSEIPSHPCHYPLPTSGADGLDWNGNDNCWRMVTQPWTLAQFSTQASYWRDSASSGNLPHAQWDWIDWTSGNGIEYVRLIQAQSKLLNQSLEKE